MVEYSYKLRMANRGVWHGWNFQDEIPVLHSRFLLVKPGEWKIAYRGYGPVTEPAITPAPAGFKSKHLWEERNIPPLTVEPGMPPVPEVLTHLAIAPIGFETWNDVSSWYYEVVKLKCKGGTLVHALADSITASQPDPRERLRTIFTWVRDHVRYIAVEIGVGGYTPHDAEDILTKRYGDCKDMVVLLCALATRADLHVLPMLTSTRQNGRADTSLPSPLQFNHLIAYAPDIDGGIWMDATDKECRFGTLPWYDQAVDVVAAMERPANVLLRTPVAPRSANGTYLDWHASVDSTGLAVVRGRSILTGALASEARHQLRSASRDEQREWIDDYLTDRTPVPNVESLTVTGTSPDDDTLSLAYTFRSTAFASRDLRAMIMRPGDILRSGLSSIFRTPNRTHPIRFRFPSTSALQLTIDLPHGWTPAATGGVDSVRSEFGTWFSQWNARDGQMRIATGYTIAGDEVPPARYTAFQHFLDSTQTIGRRELLLLRSP